VRLAIVDAFTKIKERSFIHSRNIEGFFFNFLKGHVTQTTPLSGEIFHPGVKPAMLDVFAISEERSFIHSRNIERV